MEIIIDKIITLSINFKPKYILTTNELQYKYTTINNSNTTSKNETDVVVPGETS